MSRFPHGDQRDKPQVLPVLHPVKPKSVERELPAALEATTETFRRTDLL
jgi:hypothetical protein